MKLDFEIIEDLGIGNYPDAVHFPNTQAQVFYLNNGLLMGRPTNKIDNGKWNDVAFQDNVNVNPDSNMEHFAVDALQGFGLIGGYLQSDENKHKMIIYELALEMDIYLKNGSIKHSINNPISSFTLTLENPDSGNPEHPGNVAINEENSLLSPGAKVSFKFSMGDSDEIDLGVFYLDRSNYRLITEIANADGRNLIGKALKDQTLDEAYSTGYNYIHLIIEALLQHAHLDSGQYIIETSPAKNWFDFKPNMDHVAALDEIFKATINWKMEEHPDGTIIIGSPTYPSFLQKNTYTFHRNKDIFSREIARDDIAAYRRVCIHNSDFSIAIYKDAQSYTGWNLQANKTLYVQVPDGTSTANATAYAIEIANRLENVGKIETFVGPMRPQIIPGDGATIIEKNGSKSLGLITEVTHNFGKNGYNTEFSVDSGGKLGTGRLTDYISMITREKGGSIGYDEIIMPPDPTEDPPPEGE